MSLATKVLQVSVTIGTGQCLGYLEIPDGTDVHDLDQRLAVLNKYSGHHYINGTRFNFLVVDRPAEPKKVAAKKAPKVKAEKLPTAKSAKSAQAEKPAAKKPAKKNNKQKGQKDLL